MGNIRTFIAVNVAERIRNNVSRVIDRLAATKANYKWVEHENLHVTLNFAGDVLDTEVPELCKLIKQAVAESAEPFEISLQGVNAFPNVEQPRTIWMGVDQGAEELCELYKTLADVLSVWGVNKDRNAFVPHMTLGRLGRGGRWNDELLALMHKLRNHDGGVCTIESVVVYSSYLDKSGPTYTPMATVRL